MDNTNLAPRHFGGVLMTDQRGPNEAVMLMRLTPAQDEQFSLEFYGRLIVAVLHMTKGPAGLLFDTSNVPAVTDGAGKTVSLLENGRLPDSMRRTLDKIRSQLRSRTERGAMPPAIVDQLRFFVFDKGDAPVTLDWRLQFAGKTYPLAQPSQP